MFCLGCLQTTIADPFEWAAGVDSWTVLDDWLDLDNPDGSNPPDYAPLNLPGSQDTVYVGNGGTPEISGANSVASLTIDQGSSCILSAGSLNIINGQEFIGYNGSGTFNQSGGLNFAQFYRPMILGQNPGSHGTYNLSGGVLTTMSSMYGSQNYTEIIGYGGIGTFNQTGGTHNVERLIMVNTGSYYNLSSGTLNVVNTNGTYTSEEINDNSTFTQMGGVHSILPSVWGLFIGNGSPPSTYGTYNLQNGYLSTPNEYVGSLATGVFIQSGGTNAISGFLWIGSGANATGTYAMHGGTMTTGDIRTDSGHGTFTMDGGYVNFGNGHWIRAAINSNSVANYTITGGILTNAGTGFINVGESGNGSLNVGGNAVVSSAASGNNLDFGQNSSGVGTVHVYGNSSLSIWDIRTDSGHGTFTQDGGTVNAGGWLRLGINSNSISAYTLNSGNANLNQMAQIGENGSGTLDINGGTNNVAQDMNLGLGSGTGIVNLTGGSLRVSGNENLGVAGTGTFTQTGGTNTVAGNLTLAGNSGSRGTYNLLGGALNVSGGVVINSGGTLTGNGTVGGTVANGGAVAPGNPMGTLTVNGSYAQSASGALNIEIGGMTAGSQYDQLAITGGASLNGTLNIVFTNGFLPHIGDLFTILTCGSLTGTFPTVNGATAANGLTMVPVYSGTQVILVAESPALTVVDANPLFLSSVQLPQPITQTLLYVLANASTTRTKAAADGITTLLLQFTNNAPGTVIFTQTGATGGNLTNVDGSQLSPSGVHTTNINGQYVAFVLYTVPDTITPGQTIVTLQSSFMPDGSSTSIQQTPWSVNLMQTPVVLVHGLWGDRTTWQAMQGFLFANAIYQQEANYWDNTLFAAGPFLHYSGLVNQTVQNMLTTLRAYGNAVTRADVVAHSMGGILTRIDANDLGSIRPDNFTNGYIRRVITVDTPHWGSCAAPVLSLLAKYGVELNIILNYKNHPVDKGGVQDLSPLNFAINSGGMTSAATKTLNLRSYAINGYVGSDEDFTPHHLDQLYDVAKSDSQFLAATPQNLLNQLLCGQMFSGFDDDMTMAGKMFLFQANDGVVALPSQKGGCTAFISFGDIQHTAAPDSPTILNYILNLLQGPASAFSSGFPAVTPADLNSQICRPLVKSNVTQAKPSPRIQTRLITLTAPSNGSTAAPGSNITVIVQPFTNVVLQQVNFLASGNNPAYNQDVAWDIITNAPFTDIITAPTNFFGPLTITAIGVDNQGNYDVEQSTIQILPGTNLILAAISVNLNSVGTNLTFSQLGVPQSLDVSGTYSDGVTRDITLGGAGTVYTASSPSIAVVDTNGNVSAAGNGSAQITVRNGGLSAQVPVQVSLQPPAIMSIQPDSLQSGASNVTLSLTGMNLGGTTNIMFLRNGKPDTRLAIGALVMGANAANIQLPVSVASNTPAGTLTVVVTTPVGNSGQTPMQGNQVSIVLPPVQSFTNLHSFASPNYNNGLGVFTNSDGFSPRSGLILSGNVLYGTATEGGSADNGAVFKVNTDGTGFTNLHSFTAGAGSFPNITNTDGAWPVAGLVSSGNTLYGSAESGGSSGNGTVFRVNSDGTSFTNLHSFTARSNSTNRDGAWSQAGLISSGNTLYGTAEYGGSFGFGTVFAINTNGTGFTNLHHFTGGSDGAYPVAGLILSGNTLYGTAYEGGSSDAGTVFAVNTNGTRFTTVYSFTDGNDGAGPQAGLILSGNTLYGTASQGGSSGNGTVFAVNTNGTSFTNLYSFTAGSDGADPVAGLILSGTTLYGTAEEGGSSDYGTVFRVNTDGTGFTTLHNFAGYSSDGAYPMAGLVLSGNTLFGTAESGGSSGYGTVFSLVLAATSPPQLTIVASGTNIILTWPASATGFTLQFATNLVSPTVWSSVSPAPVVINGQNAVTNVISGTQKFYRLSQ
jgi:uncharacterized repeat protein (TIGR03803 family)